MRRIEPKVFLVAETGLDKNQCLAYLQHIGTHWWSPTATSDGELLIEMMGRLCYRSFEAGLNPNVTKVREGNDVYIKNILNSAHGSVCEHMSMSFIFADVSRVFTHEVVRHRAGTAFSQESLRYVRLTDLGLWLPPEVNDPDIVSLFESCFENLEELQIRLAKAFDIDKQDFSTKKKLTSTMRRVAPIGLATTIGITFNGRSLRHVIEMRTAESAESEIRFVFNKVAEIAKKRWPNLMQDFEKNEKGEWVPQNHKI